MTEHLISTEYPYSSYCFLISVTVSTTAAFPSLPDAFKLCKELKLSSKFNTEGLQFIF